MNASLLKDFDHAVLQKARDEAARSKRRFITVLEEMLKLDQQGLNLQIFDVMRYQL